MKKNILFSSMAVIILMTASCNESELSSVNQEIQKYTYTCTIGNDDSKVAVSDNGKVTWKAGDVICVHNGAYAYEMITLKESDISSDGKSATITTTITDSGDSKKPGVYASCPGEKRPEGEGSYYDACFITDSNQPIVVAELSGTSFSMKNSQGGITFSVSGDYDSYEFSGNGDETIGYEILATRAQSGKEGRPYDTRCKNPLQKITGPISNGKASLYVTIKYIEDGKKLILDLNSGFTIKFFKGGECKKVVETSKAVSLHRNEILALGDVTSYLKDYVSPTPGDDPIFDPATATNLSNAESANCYIVSSTGNYIFKAVKGNDKSATLGGAKKAAVLWETYNNSETVVKNSVVAKTQYYEGNILVQMPTTIHAGNAVIAVMDENDIILWSWHIWVPATSITTNTFGLFNTELMDRNLGALVAATAGEGACDVTSFGLTYQWGRKDPFVGPQSATSSQNASVSGQVMSAATGQISIEESIKNPTVCGVSESSSWSTETDQKLWTKDSKTIYDPCPAGYRVPNRDKDQPLFKTITEQAGWAVGEENYWITVGYPVTVFPVSGYREGDEPGKISYNHKRVLIWSAYCSNDDNAYCLDWRTDKVEYKMTGRARARAGYIRCVKTNSN